MTQDGASSPVYLAEGFAMQTPVQVTPPAEMPVSLTDAKEHMRVSGDDEDVLITGLIESATAYLDGYTGILGRCLITQTWSLPLDAFPAGGTILLPFPDVSAATVAYRDSAGSIQTFTGYSVVTAGLKSSLSLFDGATWPATASRPDAVTVQMTAGYGDASAVPAILKHAIKTMVAAMYEGREGQMQGSPAFDTWVEQFKTAGTRC